MDITSFLIGLQKGKASAGGDTTHPVHTVTFMTEDGSVVLYQRSVVDGDDCADVVARGLLETPTKESTPQYSYTHSGWSLTSGGTANAAALDTVTEDRTVYATFTSAVRYYTVTYYDSDGATVLKTESLAYGATPSYTPSKDGASFTGWSPALATVTGDASYKALWAEKVTFAGGSWADIARISESGEAADYFKIGDEKNITVNGASMTLILIGFDHDDLADGSGKAGITIAAKSALSNTMPLNDWGTLASDMRTQLKPLLPSDLQSVIKAVNKPCDINQSNVVVTPVNVSFDLFPLSLEECKITLHYSRTTADSDWESGVTKLGTTYQYFADKYNASYGGPYLTFVHTGVKNSWFRQWIRWSGVKGAYSNPNLGTTKYWFGADTNTNERSVMFAFCI